MEFWKVIVTFAFVDEILWYDHLNERSLPVLFKMLENEIWKSGRNLPLTTFGSERLKGEKTHFRLMCIAQKVAV